MRQDPILKSRARHIRQDPTPAEHMLWQSLRHTQLGTKFTRQVPVGPYILDFAARAIKLAIEIDGDTYASQVAYDAARTAYLETQGYRVIRFTNADVMENLSGVLETIAASLASSDAPHPNPPLGGGTESSVALPPPGGGLGGGRRRVKPLEDRQ